MCDWEVSWLTAYISLCFTLHYAVALSYRNTYLLYLCSMAFKSADFHIISKIKVGRREQFPSWDKMSLSFFAQFLGNIMPVKKNWKLGYEHSTRAGGLKYIFYSQHNRCTRGEWILGSLKSVFSSLFSGFIKHSHLNHFMLRFIKIQFMVYFVTSV